MMLSSSAVDRVCGLQDWKLIAVALLESGRPGCGRVVLLDPSARLHRQHAGAAGGGGPGLTVRRGDSHVQSMKPAGWRAKAPAQAREQKKYTVSSMTSRPAACSGSTAMRQTGSIANRSSLVSPWRTAATSSTGLRMLR